MEYSNNTLNLLYLIHFDRVYNFHESFIMDDNNNKNNNKSDYIKKPSSKAQLINVDIKDEVVHVSIFPLLRIEYDNDTRCE